MNIIIITGNELRHQYFRLFLSNQSNINIFLLYSFAPSVTELIYLIHNFNRLGGLENVVMKIKIT